MGLGARGRLLGSDGQRPRKLLKHLLAQRTALATKNDLTQDVSNAKAENTRLKMKAGSGRISWVRPQRGLEAGRRESLLLWQQTANGLFWISN